jgi:hypothetical protein
MMPFYQKDMKRRWSIVPAFVASGITTEREDAKDDFLYSRLSLGVSFEYQPYMLPALA